MGLGVEDRSHALSGEGKGATPTEMPPTLRVVIGHNAALPSDLPASAFATIVPRSFCDLRSLLDKFVLQMRQVEMAPTVRVGALVPQGPEAGSEIVAASCCAVAIPLDPRPTSLKHDRHFKRLRLIPLLLPEGYSTAGHLVAKRSRVMTLEVESKNNNMLTSSLTLPPVTSTEDPSDVDSQVPAILPRTRGSPIRPPARA
jgi:oxalate---CoA ligase